MALLSHKEMEGVKCERLIDRKNVIRQKGSFLHAFEPFDKKKYLIGGCDLNPASGGPATVLFMKY